MEDLVDPETLDPLRVPPSTTSNDLVPGLDGISSNLDREGLDATTGAVHEHPAPFPQSRGADGRDRRAPGRQNATSIFHGHVWRHGDGVLRRKDDMLR